MAARCAVEPEDKEMPSGPVNPRRSPQQAKAAAKKQAAMQAVKDEEMSRKIQEAYNKVQSGSVSGMKKGGYIDGCAIKGRTRG